MTDKQDLIQRALITRIEHLENELAKQELVASIEAAELTNIWDVLFPDRAGEPFDAALVLQELRRRGLQERA